MIFFNMGIDCWSLNSCIDIDWDNFFYSGMMRVVKGFYNVVNFCCVGLGRFWYLVWWFLIICFICKVLLMVFYGFLVFNYER